MGAGYTSVISDAISPPASSFISSAALFSTVTVLLISTPFSKRAAASVRKLWRKDVLRMVTGLNQALSKKIFLVSAVTPLCKPPNTPPKHMGSPLPLHIIRSSPWSFRSFSSKVIKGVPSGRFFTITVFPFIWSASKACRGWPVSCKMKLVISTILLMGRSPTDLIRCCNHSGLSLMVTFSMRTPL